MKQPLITTLMFLCSSFVYAEEEVLNSIESNLPQESTADQEETSDSEVNASEDYLFYRPELTTGSEGIFTPWHVVTNLGLDIVRNVTYPNHIDAYDFVNAADNIWFNITNISGAVDASGGFDDAFFKEALPFYGIAQGDMQWAPNYMLHVLGEGMISRKLTEWYRYHGFSHPMLWGIGTTFIGQFVNELAENNTYSGYNVDPIVDLLFFNLLGYGLFAADSFARSFTGSVRIDFWPDQAIIDVREGRIFNSGENYNISYRPNWSSGLGLFIARFDAALAGLSYTLPKTEHTLSFGAGLSTAIATRRNDRGARVAFAPEDLQNDIELILTHDADHNLLSSLQVGLGRIAHLRFNLYPGAYSFMPKRLGAYVIASDAEGFGFGITYNLLPLMPGWFFGGQRLSDV